MDVLSVHMNGEEHALEDVGLPYALRGNTVYTRPMNPWNSAI